MNKIAESSPFHIITNPEYIEIISTTTEERVCFPSNWLKFNIFRKKADDSEVWVDGSYENNTPMLTPLEAAIEKAQISQQEKDGDRLVVCWQDGSEGQYPLDWLWNTAINPDPIDSLSRVPWNSAKNLQSFDYCKLMYSKDSSYLIECLKYFLVYGLVYVNNVPPEKTAIKSLAERISIIQKTHLEDIYALKVKKNPTNFAEISGDVSLHNDLVYKQHPPAVQLVHILKQAIERGENLFVDGLNIVKQLNQEDIELLRTTPVNFVNKTQSIHYRCVKPILVFDMLNHFQEIHFNKDKTIFPVHISNKFYYAYKHLEELLENPHNCDYSYLIPENSIVIYNNLRVLHGRKRFTDPNRYYLSCYVYEAELKSLYRLLVN